jgi:hypothetical protein
MRARRVFREPGKCRTAGAIDASIQRQVILACLDPGAFPFVDARFGALPGYGSVETCAGRWCDALAL